LLLSGVPGVDPLGLFSLANCGTIDENSLYSSWSGVFNSGKYSMSGVEGSFMLIGLS
jgi:hypothetical protein